MARGKSVLVFLTVFFTSAIVRSQQSDLERYYLEYCSGQSISPSLSPQSIKLRLALLADGTNLKREKDELLPKGLDPAKLSQADRLVAASLMYAARTFDIAKLRDLLDFKGSDQDFETSRLDLLSRIDILSGLDKQGLSEISLATSMTPPDSTVSLVENLLAVWELSVKLTVEQLKDYEQRISSISDRNPSKDFARAYFDLIKNHSRDLSSALPLLKKAYEGCSRDQTLATAYAFSLLAAKHNTDARRVLEKIVKMHPYTYRPNVDLILGELYLQDRDLDLAELHLERSRTASWYLSANSKRRALKDVSELHSLQMARLNLWRNLCGALTLLIMIGGAVAAHRRWRRNN